MNSLNKVHICAVFVPICKRNHPSAHIIFALRPKFKDKAVCFVWVLGTTFFLEPSRRATFLLPVCRRAPERVSAHHAPRVPLERRARLPLPRAASSQPARAHRGARHQGERVRSLRRAVGGNRRWTSFKGELTATPIGGVRSTTPTMGQIHHTIW